MCGGGVRVVGGSVKEALLSVGWWVKEALCTVYLMGL